MESSTDSVLRFHRDGETLWIELASRNNTIGSRLMAELESALDQHSADPSVKTLVVSGAGDKFFCPGLDLMEVAPLGRPRMADFMTRFRRLYRRLFTHPKPTLAALNGHALAGGAILACCCDFRVAMTGVRVGLTELNQVVPVPYGSLRILRGKVTEASLREAAYLGRSYSAEEALQRGWIDEVADDGRFPERVRAIVGHLQTQSNSAFHAVKRGLTEPLLGEIDSKEELEAERFLDCWFSSAAQSKIQGLMERLKGKS